MAAGLRRLWFGFAGFADRREVDADDREVVVGVLLYFDVWFVVSTYLQLEVIGWY